MTLVFRRFERSAFQAPSPTSTLCQQTQKRGPMPQAWISLMLMLLASLVVLAKRLMQAGSATALVAPAMFQSRISFNYRPCPMYPIDAASRSP
jgi:hypothetical protein